MKILCTIISAILLAAAITLAYFMHYNNIFSNIAEATPINNTIYTAIILACGFLSGFALNQGNIEELKNNTIKQLRKAEKADLNTKESLDKINRLNAKVETLEIALSEALKRKENK